MSEEREQILRMLESGAISADEANDLLMALPETAAPAEPAFEPATEKSVVDFDKPWEAPFFGGLVIAGFGLAGLTRGGGRLGRMASVSTFLLGAMVMLVGWWSRTGAWLHVHVQEADGDEVRVTLPLPLFMAGWALRFARDFVDDDMAAALDGATEFLDSLSRGEARDPFTVEIDEGDGDRVFVMIA